jgi:hypothetical protein
VFEIKPLASSKLELLLQDNFDIIPWTSRGEEVLSVFGRYTSEKFRKT